MRIRYLSLLATLLTACGEDPERPPIEVWPTSVTPALTWPSNPVTLEPFQAETDSVRIYLGETRIEVLESGAGRLRVQLPDSLFGELPIRYGSPDGRVLGTVNISGPERYFDKPEYFVSEVWPTPWGGAASVLVGAADPNRVILYSPGSGTTETLVHDYLLERFEISAPGLTPDPEVLLFGREYRADGWSYLVRLTPAVEVLDSIPFGLARTGMLFPNGVFAQSTKSILGVYRIAPRELIHSEWFAPEGMYPSPDRKLVIVTGRNHQYGAAVLDSTGLPRYYVDAGDTGGAFFTPLGDTLFVGGNPLFDTRGNGHLYCIDATTGRELARVDLGRKRMVDAIAADPGGRWIYVSLGAHGVADFPAGWPAEIVVVDRRDLSIAGRFRLTEWPYRIVEQFATGSDGVYGFNDRRGVVKIRSH